MLFRVHLDRWVLFLLLASLRPEVAVSRDFYETDSTASCVDLLQVGLQMRGQLGLADAKAGDLFVQELANQDDASYTGTISIGGQQLQAILDTGSFELVVFSTGCRGCGAAGKTGFNESLSRTFKNGNLMQQLSYGSGDTLCTDATDVLTIGPLSVPKQPLWLVREADMAILGEADFQAILGLGPPAAVKQQAKMDREQLQKMEDKLKGWGAIVPARLKSRIEAKMRADTVLENLDDSVPANLQMRYMSVCFGAETGSKGYLVWNDKAPTSRPEPFRRLSVVGAVTWGLSLKNVRLVQRDGSSHTVGCPQGCGAILDTGTSLVSGPTTTISAIGKLLEGMGANCAQQETLPYLEFELGGETITLPPDAYIGFVTGIMPAPWRLLFKQKPFIKVQQCELLMMDTGESKTDAGDLWIMGLPFFRKYYTTFDFGEPSAGHIEDIWIREADPDCNPAAENSSVFNSIAAKNYSKFHHVNVSLRQIDQSKLRLPAWMANRTATPLSL
ncbi:Ren1 [Symbiodinium pilosum]|uniref:Ren1 protein n=1 Tax=Symbiodinium pilosum TaxID=2952 RepID=A0A812V5C5_SYMPI|nr:Ren1 [Symbiodinium pilosum]